MAKFLDRVTGRSSRQPEVPFKRLKNTVDKFFAQTKKEREDMGRFLRYYKGQFWNVRNLRETDSQVFANFLFSSVNTIAPLLTDNKPVWAVRARKPHMQNYIDAYTLALGYLWDLLEMDQVSLKWLLNALIMKVGIIKCMWDPEADEVSVDVVDPRTFFAPPGYDDLWKVPICGIRCPKPLSYIRMTWPETGREVKADDSHDDDFDYERSESFEYETQTATVYEVWLKDSTMEEFFVDGDGAEVPGNTGGENKEKQYRRKYPNGRLVTFTNTVLLEDRPSPYLHGKPPYVALYDYHIPHDFTGMGEADQIEELMKSFNRNLQLFDNWTRDYCDPPWIVDPNSGLETEKVKEQIKAGGAVFEASMLNNADPIKKIQTQPIDDTVVQMMSGTTKLIEEISGVTDISKGMAMKAQRQSATEISTLIESSYTRTRQRVRNYEYAVKRLLHLMLQLMQQFYTEPRTISRRQDDRVSYYQVSNSKEFALGTVGRPNDDMEEEELQQLEEDYQRMIEDFGDVDEIYAAFDLDVDTNSSLPMDKQSLANLFLRLLEMSQSNPATAIPIWEATLQQLKVPRYKKVIADIKRMFAEQNQQQQAPQGAPAPGPLSLLRGGGANVGPTTAGAQPGVAP